MAVLSVFLFMKKVQWVLKYRFTSSLPYVKIVSDKVAKGGASMGKQEILDHLVEEGNGYLQTAVVLENNISKRTLARYVEKRGLERVAHGVYISEDAWPDDYYILYLRSNKIIFSHESALYLQGLMDREPPKTTVSVPKGYNSTHIDSNIRVIHIKPEWYSTGITTVQTTFGNAVPVYDKERTICDMVRYKKDIEIQTFQTAMKEYMGGTGKKLVNLIRYAKMLGIEDDVRTYTEVML